MRGPVPKGTPWLVKIVGPALFFMPGRYLKALEKIWIDGVIKERHWKQFLEGLEKEWDKNLIMVCKHRMLISRMDIDDLF